MLKKADVGVEAAVVGLEGEAVASVEVQVRVIGEAAVRVDGHVAVGGVGHQAVDQAVAVDIGAQQVVVEVDILGGRAALRTGAGRRLVDVGDRDREGLLGEEAALVGAADADRVELRPRS